jgi:DNA-binding beta-propeller fold protein YncE
MRIAQTNSWWSGRLLVGPAALALLMLISSTSNGQTKDPKKAPKKTSASTAADRLNIDTRPLVWPQPPSIARIKFSALYTGEKIDFKALAAAPKKPKQGWMDRLAGAQPESEKKVKVPFQFIRVYGLAVDSKGNIYAADQAVDAVFIIDPDGKVDFIRNGKEARFGLLNGLAMDDDDRLFVSDSQLHHVLVFNPQHEQVAVVGSEELVDPGGMAIDTENRLLYVVDTGSDQVKVFDADNFKLLRSIGTAGKKHTLTDPGMFSLPTHVALDGDGNVFVTDTLNNRVEVFDADGQFITEFGKAGDGPGFFARPKGIAVDCDGHVWVVDQAQSRVQVFDKDGRLLSYFGEQGSYPGQFNAPYGITIDKKNRVLVSEQFPGRVQAFQYITDAEAEAARKKQAEGQKHTPVKPAAKDDGVKK